ncbi:lectin [Bombina bombina]|uniref:lectin n=1 Tax=Bombina bombina TaxID=8345 RepID=UPI00235A4C01|nr:lectin [Bombina bombina]
MISFWYMQILLLFLSFKVSLGLIFGGRPESRPKFPLPFLNIGVDSHHEHGGHHEEIFVKEEIKAEYFCQGPCKDGWISHLGHCHIYVPQKLNWKDAEKHCQSLFKRAHLTSILNEEHNRFLMVLAQSQNSQRETFWTGRSSERGSNSWVDGSPINFLQLPKFNGFSGLLGGNFCLGIGFGGGNFWNPLSCVQKLPFICMYKPNSLGLERILENGRELDLPFQHTG